MATIMTNSRPPSGRLVSSPLVPAAHLTTHSLVPLSPRLPFPTSPAMPDRRARLKRLNMSLTSRESAVPDTVDPGSLPEDARLSKRATLRERRGHGYRSASSTRGRANPISGIHGAKVGFGRTNEEPQISDGATVGV
ncbi:hypothetical protein PoB_007632500, partial [Plakobranchus ocellatus]